MKRLYIILLITSSVFAQNANYDWRIVDSQNNYLMRLNQNSVNVPYLVASPFWYNPANNNYNIKKFWDQNQKDYSPVDGWKLIHYDFGDETTAANRLPKYPYLILYNKYTSILRVFYFVTKFTDANQATVYLRFLNGSRQSANLASAVAIKEGLLNFDNNLDLALPNQFASASTTDPDDYWLHADFPILYDPCASTFQQVFEIGMAVSSISNISWTTVGTQENEASVAASNGSQDASGGERSAFAIGVGGIKTGLKYYNKLDDIYKKYNSPTGKIKPWLESRKVSQDIAKSFEKGAIKALGKVGSTVLKAVPIIGEAVSILDGFIALFNSDEEGGKPAAAIPSKYFVNLTSTGTIGLTIQAASKSFRVPGSLKLPISEANITPFYDQPLGVFNLLDNPKVEYAVFTSGMYLASREHIFGTPAYNNHLDKSGFNYKEFHLKEDIKYTINPSSDLEVVDIQASLYARHDYNIDLINQYSRDFSTPYLSSKHNLVINGVNQDAFGPIGLNPQWHIADDRNGDGRSGLLQQTDFMPISCLKYNSSFMTFAKSDSNQLGYEDPEMWVKVVAYLKVKGSTDGKIYTHINSYKADISNSGLTGIFNLGSTLWYRAYVPLITEQEVYKYYVSSISARKFAPGGSPAYRTLTIKNLVITPKTYLATDSIIILGGNTVQSPNQQTTFLSETIEISGEFASGDNMVFGDMLTNPLFASCGNVTPTETPYSGYCTTTSYVEKTRPSSRLEDTQASTTPFTPTARTINSPKLQITPNPTTGQVTFYYSLPTDGHVSLSISNIMGVKVLDVVPTQTMPSGAYQKTIDVSTLPTGVYLVCIQTDGGKLIERMVVSE